MKRPKHSTNRARRGMVAVLQYGEQFWADKSPEWIVRQLLADVAHYAVRDLEAGSAQLLRWIEGTFGGPDIKAADAVIPCVVAAKEVRS